MQSSAAQFSTRARILVLAVASLLGPASTRGSDILQFSYTSLNSNYFGNTLFASTQPTTVGDMTKLDGGNATAHFSFASGSIGFAAFNMTLHLSAITATTANSSGSVTITDIDGDEFTATMSGTWLLNNTTAEFSGNISNVQPLACAGDAAFEGTSGSFTMAFSEPAPYGGPMTMSVALGSDSDWFTQGSFSNKPTSTIAQMVAGGTGTASPQVQISVWRSVRSHAQFGAMAIRLDPIASGNGAAGPGVESRSGGIQRIEVTFDGPVTLTAAPAAGITVVGRTTIRTAGTAMLGPPVSYSPSSVALVGTNTIALNFNPGLLPDDSCYTLAIGPGTIDQTILGDTDCSVRSQYADSTADGRVNLSDAVATLLKSSSCVAAAPRFDLDLSGTINLSDALAAKSRIASPAHQALCP